MLFKKDILKAMAIENRILILNRNTSSRERKKKCGADYSTGKKMKI